MGGKALFSTDGAGPQGYTCKEGLKLGGVVQVNTPALGMCGEGSRPFLGTVIAGDSLGYTRPFLNNSKAQYINRLSQDPASQCA